MPDNPLKIAILSIHSCPVGTLGTKDTGGMSVYILELANELGKQGHFVDIYTRVHDPRDRQIYAIGQNVQLVHLLAGEVEQIHKLAVYSHLPDFACNLEEFRKQASLDYDLVFSHYWLSAWVGQYLQLWWNVPHITTFHTLGAVKNALNLDDTEPDLRIEMEKELARSNHHIIAPTEREKKELVQHYDASPERISVVPCGVNLELFQPVGKDIARQELGIGGGRVILFVGRIEPVKGIEQLVKAMPYLQNGKNSKLVIIGGDTDNPYELDSLRKLVSELDIRDRITFSGPIKQDKLPYYYSAADVTVIPSYYESFGLVALESLACGTPVVANDVGDLGRIIRQGETGYVITDNEPQNLAEKIDMILSKQSLDMNSALLIRESVSKYAWSNIAEAITGEFRKVLCNYLTPCTLG